MEIMVVIIVIAVLASVAGPMIGSITDQGRSSATKSKMSALKSAMLAYQSDVGRLPFAGKPGCAGYAAAYNADTILNDSSDKNVLLNADFGHTNDATYNFGITNYAKKWKGPYMDSDPTDFMYDSWGNRFTYIAYKNNVYLWSSGANSAFEPGATANIECALCSTMVSNGDVDDIVLSIAKVRKKFQ